jgi:hypothetical protein
MRPTFLAPCVPLACLLCGLLSGCELSSTAGPSPDAGLAIQGKVQGGQAPIVGARVYLLAANAGVFTPNANGYGNASVSLLTNVPGSTTLDSSGGATDGDYYATTVAGGTFSITGDYTCTPGQQVYLYAVGGNPGLPLGQANPAAGLLAVLGSCPSSAGATSSFSSSLYVVMDEVSTIAAAYSFAGFATDAVHVSSSGTALAQTGIANAFANAANVETLGTGAALATTPAGNGAVPQGEIDTLANILASCVNTNGAVTGPTNATACYTLFTNAESSGSSGTEPANTATAAINIAHNPGANMTALYSLGSGSPPFSPALTTQPNDFTIGIKVTGGGLDVPENLAIDGSGNVWVVNSVNSVSKFASSSAAISPSTGGFYGIGGYTGIEEPYGIAIDTAGDAWITNPNVSYVTELNSAGTAVTNSPFGTGTQSRPTYIAIDGLSNAWITDDSVYGLGVIKLSSAGALVSSGFGYSGGGLDGPYGIAIDGSGNAWLGNNTSGTVSEFSSAGVAYTNSPYTSGGVQYPHGIAVDSSGRVWVPNYNDTVTVLSNTGAPVSGTSGYSGGGVDDPYYVAMDGAGNAWIANASGFGSTVSELTNAGTPITTSLGYGYASLSSANSGNTGIAVDGSGNVWIANDGANDIVELIGAAVPVITPIAAGLPSTPTVNGTSHLGTRP